MNRDRKISIAVAVAFHLFVLFALSPAVTPVSDGKTYLTVELAEGLPVADEGLGERVKTSTQAESASLQPAASPKATDTATKPLPQAIEQPLAIPTKEPEPKVDKTVAKTVITATPAPLKDKAATKQANKEVPSMARSMANEGTTTASPGIGNDGAKRGKPGGKGKDYYDFGQAAWLRRITPAYPELAQRRRQEGKVILTLYLNERGKLDKVEVKETSGFTMLDLSAIEAAKWSTYMPASSDGKPIPCKVEAAYTFKLPTD